MIQTRSTYLEGSPFLLRIVQETEQLRVQLTEREGIPFYLITDKNTNAQYTLGEYTITDPQGIHPAHPERSTGELVFPEQGTPLVLFPHGVYELVPDTGEVPLQFPDEDLLFKTNYDLAQQELAMLDSWRHSFAFYLLAKHYPLLAEVSVYAMYMNKGRLGGTYLPPELPEHPYGKINIEVPKRISAEMSIDNELNRLLGLPADTKLPAVVHSLYDLGHEAGHPLYFKYLMAEEGSQQSFHEFFWETSREQIRWLEEEMWRVAQIRPETLFGFLNHQRPMNAPSVSLLYRLLRSEGKSAAEARENLMTRLRLAHTVYDTSVWEQFCDHCGGYFLYQNWEALQLEEVTGIAKNDLHPTADVLRFARFDSSTYTFS